MLVCLCLVPFWISEHLSFNNRDSLEELKSGWGSEYAVKQRNLPQGSRIVRLLFSQIINVYKKLIDLFHSQILDLSKTSTLFFWWDLLSVLGGILGDHTYITMLNFLSEVVIEKELDVWSWYIVYCTWRLETTVLIPLLNVCTYSKSPIIEQYILSNFTY